MMRRRFAIGLLLGAFAIAPAALSAQTAPPPQPPAAATAVTPQVKTPPLVFATPAGLIFTPVLPAQTHVYEDVMGKVREALEKSTDPIRKQQLAGWKLFKASEPYTERSLYVSIMDPAVSGATYNVFDLLKESLGDMPARELFEKFRAAHAGPQFVLSLTPADSLATEKSEKSEKTEKTEIKKN